MAHTSNNGQNDTRASVAAAAAAAAAAPSPYQIAILLAHYYLFILCADLRNVTVRSRTRARDRVCVHLLTLESR